MPAKNAVKKGKAVKSVKPAPKKVIRKKANINLLRHINVIFVIAGFLVSLVTIGVLSSRNDNFDHRSRSQTMSPSPSNVLPSFFSIQPCPSCPPDMISAMPSSGAQIPVIPSQGQAQPSAAISGAMPPGGNDEEDNQDEEENNEEENNEEEGDANKGHGNDEDGVDEDNPGKGKGGPNAEKNAPDNEPNGLVERLIQLINRLLEMLGLPPLDGGNGGDAPDGDDNNNPDTNDQEDPDQENEGKSKGKSEENKGKGKEKGNSY